MGKNSYIITSIMILFLYYMVRGAIYGCYRQYLRYRSIKQIKDSKNNFYKLTGLYLLFIKQGQSVFLKIALILTNIQLLFIPLLFILLVGEIFGIDFFITERIIAKIIYRFWGIEILLIAIHYILEINFRKK